MVAILEDAVSCLLTDRHGSNLRQRKQYEEAKAWVTTDEESEWIFSFKNICEVLGMDPSYLRRGLIRSQNEQPCSGQQRHRNDTPPPFKECPFPIAAKENQDKNHLLRPILARSTNRSRSFKPSGRLKRRKLLNG